VPTGRHELRAVFRGGPALLALFLLCSLGACRKTPPPPAPPPPAVAFVDGEPILVATLQRELERLRRGEREGRERSASPIDPADLPRLARALLDPLIDRLILVRRARAAGLTVSDAEVQRATEALAESARAAGQLFTERLAQDGETQEGLSVEMRDRLLAEKYVSEETRKERASPAEVQAYFTQHHAELDTPEEVHALQITLSSADEAKSVLDQLRKGARFEELARTRSISPDAKSGGDLGFFPRGTMPKQFDEACFGVAAGKLSGVIQSPYGFHLFKVIGRRGAKRRSLEELRPELERRATAEKRGEAERQLLAQARKAVLIKVEEGAFALLR